MSEDEIVKAVYIVLSYGIIAAGLCRFDFSFREAVLEAVVLWQAIA